MNLTLELPLIPALSSDLTEKKESWKKKYGRYQHNVALVSQEGKVNNFMVTNVETVTM